MTLQSKLIRVRDALTGIDGLTVYHYWRYIDNPPCVIWQENTEPSALQADLHKREQAIGGTVDFFTKTEYDPLVDAIQDALNQIESFYFTLDDVQFEEETMMIHYSWTWRIL